MKYPENFLWGAATSSHQVEGNNINNDWWLWEEEGKTQGPSGRAVDHFSRYQEDFRLAAQLGHNAHRLSIEWSRIEPQEGQFDQAAITHYKDVIASLKSHSLTPVVTLHHFTNPVWFSRQGGWLNPRAEELFSRYARTMVQALGEDVSFWITINEPMVYVYYSFLHGLWPPGEKSPVKMFGVLRKMIKAHRIVYRSIHNIYRHNAWERPLVGYSKNFRPFLVCPQTKGFFCRLGVFLRHQFFNLYFLKRVIKETDFFGINYYELEYDSTDRTLKHGLLGGNCTHAHEHITHQNQLGWGLFPEGLKIVFALLKKYNKPVLITENGTCEKDDPWRKQFIEEHILQLDQALALGIPLIGYLHWSLLDNFEWHHGFGPRFGLIEVDYKTLQRTVRPSAQYYRQMIKERQGGHE